MESSKSRRPRPLADLPPDITPGRAALAAELRRGRDQEQLSLKELAGRVYSSQASVSRWLAGQSLPTEKQARAWAQVCGTNEAVMLQLLATATAEPKQDENPVPYRRRRLFSRASQIITIAAAAIVGLVVITWSVVSQHHAARCHAPYPLVLQIPPETGAHVGVTVEAVCAVPAGRTYLVIEKLPNVDPTNPHPVYFVKATISYLHIGQTSSKDFVLNEPIGTKAGFWVIGVNEGGLKALKQNQVVDSGILFLPSGTIQESLISQHTKGWQ